MLLELGEGAFLFLLGSWTTLRREGGGVSPRKLETEKP